MEDEEDIEIEQALKIAPTAIDSPFKIGRVVTDVNEIQSHSNQFSIGHRLN